MSRAFVIMAVATAVTIVLWALRFMPRVGVPVDLSDFFGGMAIGLGIGTIVTWAGQRRPSS